jgi:hypothetical protein
MNKQGRHISIQNSFTHFTTGSQGNTSVLTSLHMNGAKGLLNNPDDNVLGL